MKSSAVALIHHCQEEGKDFLINLIDSPGHVDFSSEVSTAVRLCDGAIVVVDAAEGVQPQTKAVLAQAYEEGIRPVLVLNKLDRLAVEMRMEPLDAYLHLRGVLEQVNAVIGELFAADVMGGKGVREKKRWEKEEKQEAAAADGSEEVFDWSTGLEEADDSELYFAPELGNVLFASAYDGWAFDLARFAKIFAQKLGFSEKVLSKTLWGDYYVNAKAKRIMKGAHAKAKKPLFVQLILDNLWAVYDATVFRRDKERLQKIIDALGIKVSPRDLRSTDAKLQVSAVLSQWLPLAPSLLSMVCRKLPPPNQLREERVKGLMCSKSRRFETLPPETRALEGAFLKCSSEEESPVIVLVSKMFPVPKKALPKHRPKPLTPEEIAERRERAKQKLTASNKDQDGAAAAGETLTEEKMAELKLDAERRREEEERLETETAFVAFARVYSGTLRPGQRLYVLGPKYDPAETLRLEREGLPLVDESATVRDRATAARHITVATVGELYLLLGRELHELGAAPAGSVVGIGGLEDHVLKSATVSSSPACPPFVEVTRSAAPILRVAVEPARSSHMPQLVQGLHLLNQADANVQVVLTDRGEHLLVTAGEVHLERCLRDLRETYARVDVNASSPVVPFRETIVHPPKTDMVNEEVGEENKLFGKTEEAESASPLDKAVKIQTANKKLTLTVRAVPLPAQATKLLEDHSDFFRAWGREDEGESVLSEAALADRDSLRKKLSESLADDPELGGTEERIWSVGPRKCGPNLLISNVADHDCESIWKRRTDRQRTDKSQSLLASFESSIVNGFQLATLAGPLCEEPLMGVAFVLDDFAAEEEAGDTATASAADDPYGPLSGQVGSATKEGCRRAFQAHPQRLVAAMYTCDIQAKAEVLGRLFAALGRRHGRVVGEEMVEGSSTFTVTAHLPVAESFQFAQEVRGQTSGLAAPQLVFSHWETVEVDPFWVPQTEEEVLHFGVKADSENRARRYMNDLRKRKGLAIDEKIVEFAEKQRTLTKMK